MSQLSIAGIVNAIVPISRFNRGEANKIFEEVKAGGSKVVMKNNSPACVLLSPERYEAMIEMLSDYMLFMEAERRMAGTDQEDLRTHEDVMREFGMTQAELDAVDVDIG